MQQASSTGAPAGPVNVIKIEEKGSDVNLAVHLVNDAHKKDFAMAVMITNDSDLVEPMRIVRHELGLPVGIINPQKYPSIELKKHALFIKQIRAGILKASQFPDTLTDIHGTFHKPITW